LSKLTAEMVVDLLAPSDPRVSPDGELVAFVVASMGRRGEHPEAAVWLAPTDGSAPARKLTAGTANDRAPRWSPDGRLLYFLSDRAECGKAQLHRLPAREGGEAEALTAWKAGVEGFVPLPDSQTVALFARDEPTEEDERREKERDDAEAFGERWPFVRLRLLNPGTREVRTVKALGDRHVAEAAPDPSVRSLAVVTWPTPEEDNWGREGNELLAVDVVVAEQRAVCELPPGAHELAWSADGGEVFLLGHTEPGGVSGTVLFCVAAGGGEPRTLAADSPHAPRG
jgi:dipeptidyl aminopeptidase/acylaminoacyl peptidase